MSNGFDEEAYLNYLKSDGQTVKKGKDELYSVYPNYVDQYENDKSLYEVMLPSSKQHYEVNKGLYDKAIQEGKTTPPPDVEPPIRTLEEPYDSPTLAQEGIQGSPESAQFSPYSEYLMNRKQGKNEFGQRYVEAVYSGLAKMSRNSLLLGTAMYDKTIESNMPYKAKMFVNLLRPHAEPVFEWKQVFEDLQNSPESNVTQDVWDWYESNIFSKIDEVEGLGPGLVEGLTQYMIPYLGARNLFATVVGTPTMKSILDKAIKEGTKRKVLEEAVIGSGGIAGATYGATGPGEENAIGFLMELFDLPEGEAGTMYNRMYDYFVMVEDTSDGVDADKVLREKTKAFFGDLGLDPAMTGTLLLLTKTLGSLKNATFGTLKNIDAAINGKIISNEAEQLFNYKTISEEQSISSADTDINFRSGRIPAIYNKIDRTVGWKENTITLEIGSGAGNVTDNFLKEKNIGNIKYDPYRLSEEDNAAAVATLRSMKKANSGVDTVVIANVLNVIPEESVRKRVLEQAKYAVKPNGKIYIDSYNSGKEGMTKQGYQLGRPNLEYIPEIEAVFGEGSAKMMRGGFIEVTPTRGDVNG